MPGMRRKAAMLQEYTTVKVKLETRERLKHFGHKGKTYDEIIIDLMDSHEMTNGSRNSMVGMARAVSAPAAITNHQEKNAGE